MDLAVAQRTTGVCRITSLKEAMLNSAMVNLIPLTQTAFPRFIGQTWSRTLGGSDLLPLSSRFRIILLSIIVSIKEFLKPLHKLKVVLEFPFHKLVHWDQL